MNVVLNLHSWNKSHLITKKEAITIFWISVGYSLDQIVATEVERSSWILCVFVYFYRIDFITLNRFLLS